jgi:hypothetical protein
MQALRLKTHILKEKYYLPVVVVFGFGVVPMAVFFFTLIHEQGCAQTGDECKQNCALSGVDPMGNNLKEDVRGSPSTFDVRSSIDLFVKSSILCRARKRGPVET